MEDDVEEGTVDAQVAIVVDEAQLVELIQKEIYIREMSLGATQGICIRR